MGEPTKCGTGCITPSVCHPFFCNLRIDGGVQPAPHPSAESPVKATHAVTTAMLNEAMKRGAAAERARTVAAVEARINGELDFENDCALCGDKQGEREHRRAISVLRDLLSALQQPDTEGRRDA